MNYFIIGFYFGLGWTVANTIIVLLDKVLALLLLKYKVRRMVVTPKKKDRPKPPEGLNFGSKIK